MYEAQAAFKEWYAWVTVQGCDEMVKRAERFKQKIDRILAWFDHKVNNGWPRELIPKSRKPRMPPTDIRTWTISHPCACSGSATWSSHSE